MKFKVTPVPSLALATFALLAADSVHAQSQPAPRKSNFAEFVGLSQAEARNSVRKNYVAIMGEVTQPGTYLVDPSELNLHAIIKRAGGLTDDAVKSVRVIRQGRLNHSATYTENGDRSTNHLSPGDLLIVESRRSSGSYGRVTEFSREHSTIHAGYEVASASPAVQVALVNVLDYPLVVNLPVEEATIGTLFERLGQSATLFASARLIAPSNRIRTSDGTAESIVLTSGTTVVFDKGAVRRERLPANLPQPIESNIAAGAQSGLMGSPQGQSTELKNVGQQMFLASSGANPSRDESPAIPRTAADPSTSRVPSLGQATEEPQLQRTVPPVKANPRVATVPIPFTGTPRISKSSVEKKDPEGFTNDDIPQPNSSVTDGGSTIPTVEPLSTLDENPEVPASNSSLPLAIATLTIAGAMIGGAHLYRKRLEQQAKRLQGIPVPLVVEPIIPLVEPEPIAVAPTIVVSMLERIIKGELPTTTESIEFPSEIILQGRIAAKPVLRIDSAQDVITQQGPHFVPADQMIPEASLQDVITQMDTPESMPRRPHFMTTEKPLVTTGLPRDPHDRTPHQNTPRSNAPLANALFDLERGDRS